MSLETSTLSFIRQMTAAPNQYALPMAPQIANYATVGAYGAGGFGFMNNTFSQSVMSYLAIDQDLVTRFVDMEDMDDAPLCSSALDIWCLAGDTKIPLLDGRTVSIKELAEMKSWDNLWVYSCNGEKIVPAKIKSAQKTGTKVKVLKITFDDGSSIKATPDHLFMKRDGSFIKLKDLKNGDSLMPLYRKKDKRGYEKIYDGKNWELTHRWSFKNIFGYLPNNKSNKVDELQVIHHKDFSKINNNPENLQEMSWDEHKKIHNDHVFKTFLRKDVLEKQRLRKSKMFTEWNKKRWKSDKAAYYSKISSDNYKKIWKKESFIKKMKDVSRKNIKIAHRLGLSVFYGKDNNKFRSDISFDDVVRISKSLPNPSKTTVGKALGCKYRVLDKRVKDAGFKDWSDFKVKILGFENPFFNHKVISIEDEIEKVDVFDLTIEGENHCFAAGDGSGFVIVHNSDDSVQVDSMEGRSLWVTSEDGFIKNELNRMLDENMDIENNIYPQTRTTYKYGNNYLELVVKKNYGVVGFNPLPPPTIRRIEIGTGRDSIVGFMYDPTATFRLSTMDFVSKLKSRMQDGGANSSDFYMPSPESLVFEDWEMVHMRLRGKNPYSQYGYGIFEPARWIYKRLVLLEDSMVLHRITRAPSRYAFYVDVSNIAPNETVGYLNKIKQSLKKQKFVNNSTNKVDQKYDILSANDDFYLPVRDGKEMTKVESLSGPVYDAIEDVKFFENKLFAALKVPKPFLTYEESTAKTNLSAEDTRFARSVMRGQREIKNAYKKICRVHLSAKGIDPSRVKFDIQMTIPSAIFELAQLEIKNAEIELADKFGAFAPREWILKNVMKFSDDQISEMERMRKREEMAGEEGVSATRSHSDSHLQKAIEKRHEKPEPKETEAPLAVAVSGESFDGKKVNPDQYWNGGARKNLKTIVERLEEAKSKDKVFEQRWNKMTTILTEIRNNVRYSK